MLTQRLIPLLNPFFQLFFFQYNYFILIQSYSESLKNDSSVFDLFLLVLPF
jgi:hypothetical protein